MKLSVGFQYGDAWSPLDLKVALLAINGTAAYQHDTVSFICQPTVQWTGFADTTRRNINYGGGHNHLRIARNLFLLMHPLSESKLTYKQWSLESS